MPPVVPLTVAQTAASACGPPEEASAVCTALFRITGNDVVARAGDAVILRPAKVALIVLGAVVVTRLGRRALARFVAGLAGEGVQRRLGSLREHAPGLSSGQGGAPSARAVKRAESIGALLRSMITATVWSVAILMIMGELGLDLGPLLAGAGIVGIALGFGAQNMVRDFLSGIFMLVEDQYGVGDVIDVGPATGTVESISLRTTRLRDVEGTVWYVPNGAIAHIGNKSQQWSRALLDIPVSYGTETDHAEAVIRQVAEDMWRDPTWANDILGAPEVWGVENLGADGVAIRLVVKTKPLSQWNVARQLRSRIKTAFAQEGIEIPFPQRVVWHRTGETAPDGVPVPHRPAQDDGSS